MLCKSNSQEMCATSVFVLVSRLLPFNLLVIACPPLVHPSTLSTAFHSPISQWPPLTYLLTVLALPTSQTRFVSVPEEASNAR
ncbi:hypothetical protein HWV62_20348 [Athelia sp. TMB]|nr:hypothetical protein HWV62_20348 [Athelia sp. TMB]